MIPERTDLRWREFVTGTRKYGLESLAARMLLTRLRMRTLKGDEATIQEAIAAAHAFFERNPAMSADALTLFGATE